MSPASSCTEVWFAAAVGAPGGGGGPARTAGGGEDIPETPGGETQRPPAQTARSTARNVLEEIKHYESIWFLQHDLVTCALFVVSLIWNFISPASCQVGGGPKQRPGPAGRRRDTEAEADWQGEDDREQRTDDCAARPHYPRPSPGEQPPQQPAQPAQDGDSAAQGQERGGKLYSNRMRSLKEAFPYHILSSLPPPNFITYLTLSVSPPFYMLI